MAFHLELASHVSLSLVLVVAVFDVDAMINAAKTCRSSSTSRKLNLFARAFVQAKRWRPANTNAEPVKLLMAYSAFSLIASYVEYFARTADNFDFKWQTKQ